MLLWLTTRGLIFNGWEIMPITPLDRQNRIWLPSRDIVGHHIVGGYVYG